MPWEAQTQRGCPQAKNNRVRQEVKIATSPDATVEEVKSLAPKDLSVLTCLNLGLREVLGDQRSRPNWRAPVLSVLRGLLSHRIPESHPRKSAQRGSLEVSALVVLAFASRPRTSAASPP